MADRKETGGGITSGEKAYDDTKDLSSLESRTDDSAKGGEVFDTAGLEDFYKPISSYEGIHRYDPGFQWQEAEEKKVVRKVGCLSPISSRENAVFQELTTP